MPEQLHHSVGALIEEDNRFLLIERVRPPFGFAGPAGHQEPGETPEEAIRREVKEETGLDVDTCTLVRHERVEWNWCSRARVPHDWYVFRCTVHGHIRKEDAEVVSIGWYAREDVRRLQLEEVWRYWFRVLGILS